tara:strand:- start:382 stop:663 length:282 start_codon:yes stop_codon:yes gene_type:complete
MSDKFFTVGPFKDCEKKTEDFGRHLYFNIYYNKTLSKLLDLEEERELARVIDDFERVDQLKEKIITYETMMLLAGSLTLSSSIETGEHIIDYD